MKIRGREIQGVNKVTLVLPREDDEDIVIIAKAVQDLDKIDEFVVAPKPPVALGKGGAKVYNRQDPGYLKQLMDYNTKRMAWIVLESLRDNDIEWKTVDLEAPNTWYNYVDELKASGFSSVEINHIGNAVLEANSLDEEKLNAAREVFLRGQAAAKSTSGLDTQAQSSPFGTPANDLESDPQV